MLKGDLTIKILPSPKQDKVNDCIGVPGVHGPSLLYELFMNNFLTYLIDTELVYLCTGINYSFSKSNELIVSLIVKK